MNEQGSWWQRLRSRLFASSEQIAAEELLSETREIGAVPMADLTPGEVARVHGVVSTITFRPRQVLPLLEVDLYDGSGAISLVWLGRRQLAGIAPGRAVTAAGRVVAYRGRTAIFNPRYSLRGRVEGE